MSLERVLKVVIAHTSRECRHIRRSKAWRRFSENLDQDWTSREVSTSKFCESPLEKREEGGEQSHLCPNRRLPAQLRLPRQIQIRVMDLERFFFFVVSMTQYWTY